MSTTRTGTTGASPSMPSRRGRRPEALTPGTPTSCGSRRELASRVSSGIEVTLYWCEHDDTTSVEVRRPESDEVLVFGVAGEHALEAFHHPFALLPMTLDELAPAAEVERAE